MRRVLSGLVTGLMIAAGAVIVPAFGDGELTLQQDIPTGGMAQLLRQGQAIFGIFSGPKTPQQGAEMVGNRDTDFVFYSMETGPFDIPQMQAYMAAMNEAAGASGTHPTALRIPPIRDGREEARQHVAQGIAAGVDSIVFPHVENAEEAALAVAMIGDAGWPSTPDGKLVNVLLIEDQVGVANAREIVSTPGVSVVIPGPGDLRRAYARDMEAVENAIQTVLAACKEFDVPCGITAGVDDIEERLEQGFKMIIVTSAEALSVGRRAAGR